MAEPNDMDPVTRNDLREELDKRDYPTRAFVRDELDKRDYPTRDDVRHLISEELDRRDYVTQQQFARWAMALHQSIVDDIRVFNEGLAEAPRAEVRVVDDQYKDLPSRVKRLEETVFPPSPRVRRKRRAG